MAHFRDSLSVFRSQTASEYASALFREAFGSEFPIPVVYNIRNTIIPPEAWHQYVALYSWDDGTVECVGFCNWMKYKDVYLEGGMAVQNRFYRRLDKSKFAECAAQGGIAQIMMETAAKELVDCVAWFGHCGDKRALKVDLRAGYEQIDDPHLIVKWMQEIDETTKRAWIEEIKQIGPF